MNIISIFKQFPTNEDCLIELEKHRWGNHAVCAYCTSDNVTLRGKESLRRRRWFCNNCKRSFSVTINTIFHGTRLPLQKWFLAISILMNAKKSVSSHQLGRDIDVPVKTAYSLSQRIRKSMLGAQSPFLQGIVEIDETYVGGKPRFKGTSRRGRGTNKMPVIGAVERQGNVYAEPVLHSKVGKATLRKFTLNHTITDKTHLISDEFRGYSKMSAFVKKHETINHSVEYVNGSIHTNTIEGFWAHLKRAHYGQHHHYSRKYANLYVGEACFKYNNRVEIKRKSGHIVFNSILRSMLCTDL